MTNPLVDANTEEAEMETRRSFLRKVVMGASAVAAAASGLLPLASRSDLLNQLAQHLNRVGYQICRYTKF